MQKKDILMLIYNQLYNAFGPRNWWPADTPFEVAIGAILAQNTAWKNVEKAIDNLKEYNMLSPNKIKDMDIELLKKLIKPSGYYNQKAERIKAFVSFLFLRYCGNIREMANVDLWILRDELLKIKGIGMETADSILLYACNKPVFVVDAYTKRILLRHGIISQDYTYTDIQDMFMQNLDCDVELYNEYHALIVYTGKELCNNKNPKCNICPLKDI
jgi:endonuclease-3 related protein